MAEHETGDDHESAVDPEELYERLGRGERLTVLDTRDRDEFESWHVDGPGVTAVQVPHAKFIQAEVTGGVDDLVAEYGLDADRPLVAVCGRGEASDHAASLLRAAGVDAVNLAGGMDAWARTYVSNEIGPPRGRSPEDPTVVQYVRPSSGCLAYLVVDGRSALVVDPLRAFADRYVADARDAGVEITGVVDTHVHADHVSGLRDLADRTGATAYLPAGAADRGLAFDATFLEDGDAIPVGESRVEAIEAPGHTTEMTALRVDDVLLTGDSLFVESVARPDLEAGDEGAPALAQRLYTTLHDRLLELPDDTVVAPGHVGPRTAPNEDGTYTARLGALRDRLDLLGVDREEFVSIVLDDVPPRPANYRTIVAVNLGQDSIDGSTAFELELGPNNCAVSS